MNEAIYKRYKDVYECKGHKAFPVLINDKFWIVDWRKAEGGSDYNVRYIIDIKRGNLIITGDLGDCVASWYNEVVPEDMKDYVQSIDYFIGKMRATSDKYSYDYEDIHDDIKAIKEEILKDLLEDEDDELSIEDRTEEVEDDFETICDFFDENAISEDICYPSEITDIFEKYRTDWWKSSFVDIGKRIHPRVYLWAVGLKEAYLQISKEKDNA